MIDLGNARHIEARATGRPGQRMFHLRLVTEAESSASLKIEKEHVVGLRIALQEILAQLGFRGPPSAADVVHFPSTPDHDFAVGRLGLGYSRSDQTIVIEVHELAEEADQEATALSVRFNAQQAANLAVQLEEIVAAGRPMCPLCRAPMSPEGHVCIRSNGQSQQPIPDEGPA